MSLQTLGDELRAARESKSIPLSRVARETRIALSHLENIERGEFRNLPGGMYNRAFLRSYCEFIGLDAEPVLGHYSASNVPAGERPMRKSPPALQVGESQRRVAPVLVWSLMLTASIAGIYLSRGWIGAVFSPYFTRPRGDALTVATPKPDRAVAPGGGDATASNAAVPAPAPQTGLRPESDRAPVAGPRLPAMADATSSTVAVPAPFQLSAPLADAAGSVAVSAVAAAAAPNSEAPIRLEFQVTAKCWVSVMSDGNRVLVKLLEPGDALSFEATDRFYVKLGNAGGVRMALNGRRARALGVPGEVVALMIRRENLHEFLEPPLH